MYFARDCRLAHWFIREQQGESHTSFQMILARVVVVTCARRKAIKSKKLLLKKEHRAPPPGYHSVTSHDAPGREIVVFPGSPCVPAYPAYMLTCRTALHKDPYRDLTLQKMWFGERYRDDAHVFNRYRLWYRPAWRCLTDSVGHPQEFDSAFVGSGQSSAWGWRQRAERKVLHL